jgi:hypothetical protein
MNLAVPIVLKYTEFVKIVEEPVVSRTETVKLGVLKELR